MRTAATRHDRRCITPYDKSDLLGKLFQGIARLRGADFLSVSLESLGEGINLSIDTCWLLFCTHPLREVENVHPPKPRPFLTYYSFAEFVDGAAPTPLDDEGADAADVHRFIRRIEEIAVNETFDGLDNSSQIESAKKAGALLQHWIESVTRFGAASFLEEEKYFVPIPVALVRLRGTT